MHFLHALPISKSEIFYFSACILWYLFDFHYIVGLSVREGLNQTLELSEMTRQQLEEEIQALNREKGDIQEQLSSVSKQTSISRTHCNIIIMTFSKRANIIKTWMKSLNYYRIHYDDKFLKKKQLSYIENMNFVIRCVFY